jgi:hypothetical protein
VFRRLRRALTNAQSTQDPGPARPNQLRREDVVLPRRRATAPPARDRSGVAARSQSQPRPPVSPPLGQPAPPPNSLRAELTSRGGLRRAMLLREVLGPPVSLRDPSSRDPQG